MLQSSMINIVLLLVPVSLPVLVIQSKCICTSTDTHALAVAGTCKYFAVQVMTGLAHIMSAKSK